MQQRNPEYFASVFFYHVFTLDLIILAFCCPNKVVRKWRPLSWGSGEVVLLTVLFCSLQVICVDSSPDAGKDISCLFIHGKKRAADRDVSGGAQSSPNTTEKVSMKWERDWMTLQDGEELLWTRLPSGQVVTVQKQLEFPCWNFLRLV